jgi:hypothetical protein
MGPEYDGPGHREGQQVLLAHLQRAGLPLSMDGDGLPPTEGVRDGRQQITGPGGTPHVNKPDLSYMGRNNTRVNVEIDTSAAGSLAHQQELIRNDRQSRHVFFLVDPRTGQVRRKWIYDPSRHQGRDLPVPVRVTNPRRMLIPPPGRPPGMSPLPRWTRSQRGEVRAVFGNHRPIAARPRPRRAAAPR